MSTDHHTLPSAHVPASSPSDPLDSPAKEEQDQDLGEGQTPYAPNTTIHSSLSSRITQSTPIPYTNLRDKTILITGGASGFGEACFRSWASHGANVIIGDINASKGAELVAELRQLTKNENLHFVHLDVTSWTSQVAFFQSAARMSPHGGIDRVVANAGIADAGDEAVFEEPVALYNSAQGGGGGNAARFDVDTTVSRHKAGSKTTQSDIDATPTPQPLKTDGDSTPQPDTADVDPNLQSHTEVIDILPSLASPPPPPPSLKIIDVNLYGVLYTTHLALSYLPRNPNSQPCDVHTHAAHRDRHLLLVSSIAGLAGLPSQPLYAAAKHGVVGLFRTLRLTTPIKHGVRVNMINPYFVDTPILGPLGSLVLAGGAIASLDCVLAATTRLVADQGIIGRALAIGPKTSVEHARAVGLDQDLDLESDTPTGQTQAGQARQAIWDVYAHDFEQSDLFTRRIIAVTKLITRARGWMGVVSDVTRKVAAVGWKALGY